MVLGHVDTDHYVHRKTERRTIEGSGCKHTPYSEWLENVPEEGSVATENVFDS
jgi:hypothetical protein